MLHLDQVAGYDKDGSVVVKYVFSPPEVAAMLRDMEGGSRIAANTHERAAAGQKVVKLAMPPGSVLFFDCSLLHASVANESDADRRAFIGCYNALTNPRLTPDGVAEQQPCPIGSGDAVSNFTH